MIFELRNHCTKLHDLWVTIVCNMLGTMVIKASKSWIGFVIGSLLSMAFTGISFAMYKIFGTPFIPFDLFDWLTRILPGAVVTFGIDLMIDTIRIFGIGVSKAAIFVEQSVAVILFVIIGGSIGFTFFLVARHLFDFHDKLAGISFGLGFGIPMFIVHLTINEPDSTTIYDGVWLLILFIVWGFVLNLSYKNLVINKNLPPVSNIVVLGVSRRRFLVKMGTATAVITIVGMGAGEAVSRLIRKELTREIKSHVEPNVVMNSVGGFLDSTAAIVPAPGTRSEYTPIKDHYKVSIRIKPTIIDEEKWTLPITGEVENPMILTLKQIRDNYRSREQYVTLNCISGRLGTDLIGTTLWTGASFQDILDDVNVMNGVKSIFIRSGDGFYESINIDLVYSDSRIMLAYAWDGNPIPVEHGFPLRLWIPDRYGMKQPKWITGIELLGESKSGYWVERGWDPVARVKTVSVIDTVAVDSSYRHNERIYVPIGGIAFAGSRGIGGVEISVDSGPWMAARLLKPPSETTWVIWRYDWMFESGEHTFEVRSTEIDGTPQIVKPSSPRPSGATGIHSKKVRI